MPDPSGVLRRSDDLAMTTSDDRVTVLDLNALERPPLILEGTAMDVWQLLDVPRDRAELARLLAEQYDAPEDEIAAGLLTFLDSLLELGVVVEAPGEGEHA